MATRAAMPYGILALALVYALPGVVVLASIGANLYWISLVLKLQHLLSEQWDDVAGLTALAMPRTGSQPSLTLANPREQGWQATLALR